MNKQLTDKIFNLAYGSQDAAAAEKEISELLKAEGDNGRLQILLLQAQMAGGETERALLTADRIWDYGEALTPELQCCYVRNLTALGKNEMAQRMICPLIRAGFPPAAAAAADYVIMSGDNQTAEFLDTTVSDENFYNLLNNYIRFNNKNDYWRFLQRQGKIIYETLCGQIVGISCRLFPKEDNNTGAEMNLYIREDTALKNIRQQLEEKLSEKKILVMENLLINIEGINHCPSMALLVPPAG